MRYVAALGAMLAVAGTALASDNSPKAFERPARPTDALPAALRMMPPEKFGFFVVSRRIATYDGGPHRRARLYLLRTARGYTCSALVFRGVGMGCNRGALLVGGRLISGEAAGQLLAGVAANEVTRIVVVGSRGVHHHVPLSPDKGFIYDCRAYNGCPCAVAWLDAYAGERRVAHQDWLGSGCRKRR